MKAAIHNLGCKVNSYEAESMREQLINNGYEMVDFSEKADVYIVNTCSVTNIADRKSRQMLHRAKKLNPDAVVVAAGCYVQEVGDELLRDNAVDIILGNNKKSNLAETLADYFKDQSKNANFVDIGEEKLFEETPVETTDENIRVNVKVQDGCNNFCTYCIIPYTRGRIRSRSISEIQKEVTGLADKGYKEIVINGINLSSYGLDLISGADSSNSHMSTKKQDSNKNKSDVTLIELLEKLNEIDGIERIRMSSLEPRVISFDFVERLKKLEKICHHFHLSMQSGCDETLKRMNRHYTSDEYFEACLRLRKAFDDAAITTDVIVGFPGETEEEFEKSYDFCQKVGFADLHVFKYSKRKGTKAADMPNQLTEKQKHERSEKLIKLGKEMSEAFRNKFLGEEAEVLFEEKCLLSGEEYYIGHTRQYLKVCAKSDENLVGKNMKVLIDKPLESEILLARI
ncbi:MAG: tRNA (N(6)-L-threonylcarbamoyladenosine(37)-C(2))-methylthiotransferase MtaB [Parasporobacterium sp.]|nr:tRNA (N(6)-L-threonylcarbamoyladenosine(37)-C(2))-methylthiotransferase MtaB [Parasporobacterium sp.]